MKITLTKQQQNILVMAGIVVAAIAVLFIFIYAPKEAQVKKLRQELKGIQASLANIEAIVGSRKDVGSGILKLRQEVDVFETKFIRPDSLNGLLQTLSEEARNCDLDVISVQPSEFIPFYNAKGSAISVDGATCNKISIDMSVTGPFRSVIDYMEALERKDSPRLLIKKFNIEKQQQARLNAYIIVDGFALLPKKAG